MSARQKNSSPANMPVYFKYTLRHASFVHVGMQSLMQKLWFEVMVRYDGVEDLKKEEHFGCLVHIVAACGMQDWFIAC